MGLFPHSLVRTKEKATFCAAKRSLATTYREGRKGTEKRWDCGTFVLREVCSPSIGQTVSCKTAIHELGDLKWGVEGVPTHLVAHFALFIAIFLARSASFLSIHLCNFDVCFKAFLDSRSTILRTVVLRYLRSVLHPESGTALDPNVFSCCLLAH